MNDRNAALHTGLVTDAQRCVKCALCLPHCPTYTLKGEEGDSPRGRIALIQALAEGALAPTATALEHLDGCLDCRACEAVCPAGVPYGRLIDGARAELGAHGSSGFATRATARIARHPAWIPRLADLARRAAALPLPAPLARLRPYLQAVRRLPRLAGGPETGPRIALFLGCVARALDTQALSDSATLLAAAGYRVEVPRRQTCCGALALHGGARKAAVRLARRNLAAFRERPLVVATATACTAQLAEYGELHPHGRQFADRVRDVSELLARAVEERRLARSVDRPLRVALHVPCTQRNVLRSGAGHRCLNVLPGVEIVELPSACCGAAGSYFLDRPDESERLRAPLLEAIRAARAECVVTTNVGCRLHLAAGLGQDGPEVVHLASFLARHLSRPAARMPT